MESSSRLSNEVHLITLDSIPFQFISTELTPVTLNVISEGGHILKYSYEYKQQRLRLLPVNILIYYSYL